MFTLMTFFMFGLTEPAFAADPNKPHEHKGKATKFTNPKKTNLSPAEKAKLKSGNSVRKQVRQGKGGRGIAIMDVAADSKTVWSVITDYKNYPKWIDKLAECNVYKKQGNHVFTRFLIKSMLPPLNVEYYIDHNKQMSKGLLTWQLDYNRQSDLDDSTGYWMVYPSPDNPGKTRVEYSVDIRIKGWVPKFVENMLADKGLEDATKWVKKQAEKRAK